MALKLSEGQKRAIDTRNKNILVSAAAGSGKTFVLTKRVLSRIIEDRWNIDSFLIVTFTRDAAAEMKGRIVKSIEEKLKEVLNDENRDEELRYHLEKQLILIDRANISTIDAFCSRVIRQNFHKTNLDTGYKNPTAVETAEIKRQAINDVLEELLGEDEGDFFEFYNEFVSKTNDEYVVEMIYKLYEFADNSPYPELWLNECSRNYNEAEGFYDSIYGKIYVEKIKADIDMAREYINKAMEYFKYIKPNEMPKNALNMLYAVDDFDNAFKMGGIDEIAQLSFNVRLDFRSVKEEYALEHIDVIKRYFTFAKNCLTRALKNSSQPSEKIDLLFEKSKENVNALIKAVRKFMLKYNDIKTEKQLAEFNDIAHACLNILRDSKGNPTKIAREYQKKFNEIIIDEYQDSNYLQETILTSVSKIDEGINNIFMVGDVKQAIYRFRQTTPELFIKKYDKYSGNDSKEELILLSENYRSRKVVLDACNIIFKQLMDKRLGNVDYTDEVALNPKADFPEPDEKINISDCTELLIVDIANVKNGLAESDIDRSSAEAKVVAERIYEMLYTDPLYVYDKDTEGYRPVSKKDIVILVNRRTHANVFFEELNSIGINCVFEVSNPLFKTTEVKTVLSLLRIIDNPLQDIDMVAVLHSPMYGMSFDEITEIRINNRYEKIYNVIKEHIECEGKFSQILKKILYDIGYYRDFAINNSISDLLSEIYDRSNYFNYCGIQSNGSFRQSNLRLFKEIALSFESKGPMDLGSFIEYIDTDLSDDVDNKDMVKVASEISENEDAVRIKTIHKSKGLEYPVVFVSQLQNKISDGYKKNNYIFDRELGIGLKYIDNINRIKYSTLPYDIIVNKYEEEEKSEVLRLLYVALTRAREKLIITGVTDSTVGKTSKNAVLNELAMDKNTILPFDFRYAVDNPLFWVLSAIKRSDMDIENTVKQKWIMLENVPSLDEFKTESVVNVMGKIAEAEEYKPKGEYNDIISEKLEFEYPNINDTLIPSKISITEIKRKMMEAVDYESFYASKKVKRLPDFIKKGNKISFAQMGTLYHTVMEHMDFLNIKEGSINEFVESLSDKGIITSEEKNAIDIEKIKKFMYSDLFGRIKKSNNIFKESPFVMSIKASRIKEYEGSESEITVHGIIDLYFEEEGKIVLVDYKTDKIKNNVNELLEKYKIQMELYKEALEKNTGKEVSEFIIYSIDKGEEVNVKF